jgi:hypothetical protein
VSHEYHKNTAAVDALNPGQYHVTPENGTERPGAATTCHDSEYERAHQWRDATRELVLAEATAMAAADPPQSQCSISITLTGNALSNDLLLADTGIIVLTSLRDRADASSHPMRVVPVRLDMLSDLPAVHVLGRGVTDPTRLRLVVELTARNPHTDTTSVMACEYDSVLLDAQTPLAVLDFQLQHDEPHRYDHTDPHNSPHRMRHHQPDTLGAGGTKIAPVHPSEPQRTCRCKRLGRAHTPLYAPVIGSEGRCD